jgi:hypothetical protein
MLEFAGRAPETVTLIGVVPARVAMGTTLSAPVARSVPAAVSAIVDRLKLLEIPVVPRLIVNRDDDCPWWTDTGTAPLERRGASICRP